MNEAFLLARTPVGGDLWLVELDVSAQVRKQHVECGQYIELRHPGTAMGQPADAERRGYFALSSSPGAPFQIVVRASGSLGERLMMLPIGSTLRMSDVMGKGFAVDALKGSPLVIAVAGSGIGAVRSLLERRATHGDLGLTSLYYGLQTPAELAFGEWITSLAIAGLQLYLCLSKGEVAGPNEYSGYVQHVLAKQPILRASTNLVAVGSDAMLAELEQLGGYQLLRNL